MKMNSKLSNQCKKSLNHKRCKRQCSTLWATGKLYIFYFSFCGAFKGIQH